MVFDLGGKRKRVVQVVFGFLALVFAAGFVLFGIGSDVSGGLFDGLGVGSNSTDADPALDNQIERAEEALAADPEDEKALLTLAQTHFLKGQNALEKDEQGQPVGLTDESLSEYGEATDAWEKYLATEPENPDDGVAPLIVQAYDFQLRSASTPGELEAALDGAVEATKVVADARPSAGSYSQLSYFAYLAGETKSAQEAEKKALAEASDSSTKAQISSQLEQAKAQGKALAVELKQAAEAKKAATPDQEQLENPLGGFGGTAPPTSPLPGGTTPLPGESPAPAP